MQARVETPDRDQFGVVTRFTREVPESHVAGWANLHNRSERAEAQPTPAYFLFQQLLIVTARVRSPVRITHHGRALHRNDRSTQTFLGSANIAAPKYAVLRTAGIGAARH